MNALQKMMCIVWLCCAVLVFSSQQGMAASAMDNGVLAVSSSSLVFPSSVTDASSIAPPLAAQPALRIVSLYPAFTDMLLELGAAHAIVGKTQGDTTSALEQVASVGTHMRPSVEMITALEPSVVIVLQGRNEAALLVQQLERMGISVLSFKLESFADIFTCLQQLGDLTGQKEQAAAITAHMQQELDAISALVQKESCQPTVFFEVRYPQLLGAGGGSMVQDIITRAGGKNVLADYSEKMVRLNEEALVALNPDVYIYQEGGMNKNPVPPREREHFVSLAAVQQQRCHLVDEVVFSRPGVQSVKAVKQLAFLLFPAVIELKE